MVQLLRPTRKYEVRSPYTPSCSLHICSRVSDAKLQRHAARLSPRHPGKIQAIPGKKGKYFVAKLNPRTHSLVAHVFPII